VSRVGAAGRVRDAAAALLLVAGVALYLHAASGMRAMAAGRLTPPPGRTHLAQTDRMMTQSRLGLFLAAAGVAVGVWSYLRHRATTTHPE
jgi:hypothetical protein